MNEDSKVLTKIFEMVDEIGLYCSLDKRGGEVVSLHFAKKTFFPRDCCREYIHDHNGSEHTYEDLKKFVLKFRKELDK